MSRVRLFVTCAIVAGSTMGACAQDTSVSTKAYVDIQQLYARYNLAIDTGDAEGWAATFTPDGVFNDTNKGHDALVQFIKDWRAKRDGANRRHINSNLVLTPTADGVKGSIHLVLLNVSARPATIALTAMYEDVLVRTSEGWRFKSRIVHSDPAPAAPTAQP